MVNGVRESSCRDDDTALEVSSGESESGTGFEVPLKGNGSRLVFEPNGQVEFPRPELGCMRRCAFVVLAQSFPWIMRETYVSLTGTADTANHVYAPHEIFLPKSLLIHCCNPAPYTRGLQVTHGSGRPPRTDLRRFPRPQLQAPVRPWAQTSSCRCRSRTERGLP